MKVIVKELQGKECSLEVLLTTCISEIKRQIAEKLNVPVDEQKLLLFGRTLLNDQTIESYPAIKDGTKLYLVVKKPEGLHEVSMKYFKKLGMSDIEATNAAKKLLKVTQEKFNKLSWDDIERLAQDCLKDETGAGQTRPTVEHEAESEEYTL